MIIHYCINDHEEVENLNELIKNGLDSETIYIVVVGGGYCPLTFAVVSSNASDAYSMVCETLEREGRLSDYDREERAEIWSLGEYYAKFTRGFSEFAKPYLSILEKYICHDYGFADTPENLDLLRESINQLRQWIEHDCEGPKPSPGHLGEALYYGMDQAEEIQYCSDDEGEIGAAEFAAGVLSVFQEWHRYWRDND